MRKSTEKTSKLTKKEEEFCRLYAAGRSPREAAAACGFFPAVLAGIKLLQRQEIRQRAEEIRKANDPSALATAGLYRLAFGSVADAVRLMTGDGDALSEPEKLDLINISEIKFAGGGKVEIKFFDRLKAMTALADLGAQQESDGGGLIAAIMGGAGAMNGGSDENGKIGEENGGESDEI